MNTYLDRLPTDHEVLNRVVYSETELARVESERPIGGEVIATNSGWMLAAYRMPNGSKFVTLKDGSESTWEAYCAELVARNAKVQS